MGSCDETGRPYDLDHQLANCLQEFGADRERYWEKRTDGADWGSAELYGHAEQIAQLLLIDTGKLVAGSAKRPSSAAFDGEHRTFVQQTLAHHQKLLGIVRSKLRGQPVPEAIEAALEWLVMDERPEADSLLALVWERLCMAIAGDFIEGRLVRGATRMLHLMRLIEDSAPHDITLRYIRRVSRCFILGLDTECAILCRAAIDSAVGKAVPDSYCLSLRMDPKADGRFTLSQRIWAAKEHRLLDDRGVAAARRVNKVGTEAVHKDPDLVKGVFSVIQDMLVVVKQLAPGKQSRRAKPR